MARLYDAEELIDIVRLRAGLNNAQTEGTLDSDILNVLNEEALTTLYSIVIRAREEYFVVTELVDLVSTKNHYRINPRAMHQKIRDIFYRNGTIRTNLNRLAREYRSGFSESTGTTNPSGYDFEGNHIVLYPDIGFSYQGQLEVSFYFRPGELVLSTECRTVSAVDLNTGIVTIDSENTEWSSSTALDVHSPNSGAEIKAWSITPSVVATTSLTFTAAQINGSTLGRLPVEIGDYVCTAESAALPGLPRELHPVLAQAAVCRFLESRDPERFQLSNAELQAMIQRQYEVMGQRDDSQEPLIPIINTPHLFGGIRRTSFGKGPSY